MTDFSAHTFDDMIAMVDADDPAGSDRRSEGWMQLYETLLTQQQRLRHERDLLVDGWEGRASSVFAERLDATIAVLAEQAVIARRNARAWADVAEVSRGVTAEVDRLRGGQGAGPGSGLTAAGSGDVDDALARQLRPVMQTAAVAYDEARALMAPLGEQQSAVVERGSRDAGTTGARGGEGTEPARSVSGAGGSGGGSGGDPGGDLASATNVPDVAGGGPAVLGGSDLPGAAVPAAATVGAPATPPAGGARTIGGATTSGVPQPRVAPQVTSTRSMPPTTATPAVVSGVIGGTTTATNGGTGFGTPQTVGTTATRTIAPAVIGGPSTSGVTPGSGSGKVTASTNASTGFGTPQTVGATATRTVAPGVVGGPSTSAATPGAAPGSTLSSASAQPAAAGAGGGPRSEPVRTERLRVEPLRPATGAPGSAAAVPPGGGGVPARGVAGTGAAGGSSARASGGSGPTSFAGGGSSGSGARTASGPSAGFGSGGAGSGSTDGGRSTSASAARVSTSAAPSAPSAPSAASAAAATTRAPAPGPSGMPMSPMQPGGGGAGARRGSKRSRRTDARTAPDPSTASGRGQRSGVEGPPASTRGVLAPVRAADAADRFQPRGAVITATAGSVPVVRCSATTVAAPTAGMTAPAPAPGAVVSAPAVRTAASPFDPVYRPHALADPEQRQTRLPASWNPRAPVADSTPGTDDGRHVGHVGVVRVVRRGGPGERWPDDRDVGADAVPPVTAVIDGPRAGGGDRRG